MNGEEKWSQVWQESIRDAEIAVDQEELIAFLGQAVRRIARKTRLAQLSDMIGGFVFVLIVAFLVIRNPSIVEAMAVSGKIGALLFVATFGIYHLLAFRARQEKVPTAPTLVQLLAAEKRKVSRQITLFANLGWFLLVSLSGLVLLGHSFTEEIASTILFALLLLTFGVTISLLGRRAITRQYLPLQADIEGKLQTLQQGR